MTPRRLPAQLAPWLVVSGLPGPGAPAVRLGGDLGAWLPPSPWGGRVGGILDWPEKAKEELDATDRYLSEVDTDFNKALRADRARTLQLFAEWKTFYGQWLAFLKKTQEEGISYLNEGEVREKSLAFRRQGQAYQEKLNQLRPGSSDTPRPPDPPQTQLPSITTGLAGVGVGLGAAALLALVLALRK